MRNLRIMVVGVAFGVARLILGFMLLLKILRLGESGRSAVGMNRGAARTVSGMKGGVRIFRRT